MPVNVLRWIGIQADEVRVEDARNALERARLADNRPLMVAHLREAADLHERLGRLYHATADEAAEEVYGGAPHPYKRKLKRRSLEPDGMTVTHVEYRRKEGA